ncbi:MAG: tungstate ABC transporter substrate-binding protein WtpA [Rhodothermaceae bacterium]
MKTVTRFTALILASLLLFACASQKKEEKLVIFHAGSLSVPFKEIITEFNKIHPEIKIEKEIAGSRTCARKISDLKKPCDIMASADYTVIDNLLIPDHADWNIKFAANEMTIVYTEHSKKHHEINKENWYKVLLDKEVAFGRSDPNADPCGYRSVLTMRLAENFYNEKGVSDKLLAKDNEYIRPKETDLLALLESGELDYIFLYRSVAEQHGLKYILLPDEINLKQTKFADNYKLATVEISGKKPGEKITKKGAPMVYGITIPKNSPNPEAAKKFLTFVLSKENGLKILEKNGQPTLIPSPTSTFNKIPKELKQFASAK